MENYDAIIIGSGIGGMTCGGLLAQNGLKTLIVEQHWKAGGCVTSYKRQGFLFDVVAALGGMRQGSPIQRIITSLGIDTRVTFQETEKLFRLISPERSIDFCSGIDPLAQELKAAFPNQAAAIHAFLGEIDLLWDDCLRSRYRPGPLSLLSYPLRYPRLFKYRNFTYRQLLDRYFDDSSLKHVLSAGWQYLGLPASRASAIYMVAMLMSYLRYGTFYPLGGYQKLSNGFAAAFRAQGGEMRFSSRVSRIMVERGRAKGVRLASGEELRADTVIANSDSRQTFLDLLGEEQLSGSFVKRIKKQQLSASGLTVHLGVKMDIPSELTCGTAIYSPVPAAEERLFDLADLQQMETDPAKLSFGINIPTLKDPSLAPKGCHVVELILYPAPYHAHQTWMSNDQARYRALKDEMGDLAVKAAEQVLPGLAENTVIRDVSTPLSVERYTAASQGCWYDAAQIPQQAGFNRLPARTPVKGLLLTGAKSFPGHGMFGAMLSGSFTADQVLGGTLTKGGYFLQS